MRRSAKIWFFSIAAATLCVAAVSAIRFTPETLPFVLQNSETAERHAPETMPGGVAVFDYDNDGDLDIFFTNGAEITTLRKRGERDWDRLYANDGHGRFTDVTAKAGLAGSGYDMAVSAGDYDNDGFTDFFSRRPPGTRCSITTATARSRM